MQHSIQELTELAKEARRTTMEMIASLGKGHVGGALDIVDVLTDTLIRGNEYRSEKPQMLGETALCFLKDMEVPEFIPFWP